MATLHVAGSCKEYFCLIAYLIFVLAGTVSSLLWFRKLLAFQVMHINLFMKYIYVLQAKNTSIARQRACDESKNAYAAELQKTNQAQREHYHTLMPRVFDVIICCHYNGLRNRLLLDVVILRCIVL
jgi:hypothetical protein